MEGSARLGITAAALCTAGLGFAVGFTLGKRTHGGDDRGAAAGTQASGEQAGRRPLSALPSPAERSSFGGSESLRAVARDGRLGMFVKLRAYLRLANSVPLSELDELLVEIAREVPEELGGETLVEAVGRRWAREDPQGAYAALLGGRLPSLEEARNEITSAIAASDPEAAWQMVLAMNSAERRGESMRLLLRALGRQDMDAALARVEAMENPRLHQESIRRFLVEAAENHPVAALRTWGAIGGDPSTSHRLYLSAFSNLAVSDFDAALEQHEQLRDPSARMTAAAGIASGLGKGKTEIEDVKRWIATLPTVTERDAAFSALLRGHGDHEVAAAAIGELRSPGQRLSLAGHLASSWFQDDREAALNWARETLAGSARERALDSLLTNHGSELAFEQQRELAEELRGDAEGRSEFVERWAEREPVEAAEWVVRQTGTNRELIDRVYSEWVKRDIEAAEGFLDSIGDGGMRQVAEARIESRRERMARAKQEGGGE